MKKDDAIFNVLRDISSILKILFEGDGYSEAWEVRPRKRD
jgi:glutamine synthetase